VKSVNGITRLVAAATALSVTFAMAWSVTNLSYPGAVEMRIQLAPTPLRTPWSLIVR
jgi:hypothetical protein